MLWRAFSSTVIGLLTPGTSNAKLARFRWLSLLTLTWGIQSSLGLVGWAQGRGPWMSGGLSYTWVATFARGVLGLEQQFRFFFFFFSQLYFSLHFSHSVVSDSLQPHGLQHARPPCLSPTPRVYSNSCPLSRWCHPTNHLILCLPLLHLPSVSSSIRVFLSWHKNSDINRK